MPLLAGAALALAAAAGCQKPSVSGGSLQDVTVGGATGNGTGTNVSGLGGASAPTANGVISRIQNALGVSPRAGNFAKSITQVRTNLPQTSNPLEATGFDQVPLLVYAACSDAKMQTFNLSTTGTITSNSAALVAAGMTILDNALGGLASQGPLASEFQATLQNLVNTLAADQANAQTVQTAFIAVCMAATTASVSMTGY
jgi:hypothetical protein